MAVYSFNLVRVNQASNCLGGIRNPEYQRRDKFSPRGDDGGIHQTSNSVIRSSPMARFSTVAVRSLFALLTAATELPMVALDGTNGLEMIGGQINSAGPGFLAGSVHARRKAPRGQLYLSGVSWTAGDVAEATAEAFFTAAAGGTDPVTSDAIAMPTIPVNTEQMVLSALTLAGTAVPNPIAFEAQLSHQCENNDEEICFDKGLPYPVLLKEAGVGGQSEVIATIDTRDLTTAFAASGVLVAQFTSLAALGVGLGSATATLTINGGQIREESIPGTGARRLTIRGTFDGTNRPVTVAVA